MSIKLPRPAWNKNSPHHYGVWTHGEAAFMDRFLAQVGKEFGYVRFLEIGVAEGATMAGVLERCDELRIAATYEGVDGPQGRPSSLPANAKFIEGDSAYAYPQVGTGFNICFIDGSHALNYVMLDFLNYSPKVVVGGYCLFHDTREGPEWQKKHYQGTGPTDLDDNNIAVREALKKLGLLDNRRRDWKFIEEIKDTNIMGMILIKKLEEL